jgi:hypothetical protein
MYNHKQPLSTNSLRVGLVGTGYAAKLRAENGILHQAVGKSPFFPL